ncbi:MAG: glycosyltransferase family 2 protein, partial [Nitrososphaera sp.]
MVQAIFVMSVLFVFYAYLGYPLALLIMSIFRNRPITKGDITPCVSFIITAYNEEQRIGAKIDNTLKQDYPSDMLEIIVASDCSTDRTDEIVKSYKSYGVRLVRASERRGKEAAQQLAVQSSAGAILVFSDVATTLPVDGVTNIVKNFYDPTVGCVSSVDRFIDEKGNVSGEGLYVRYEMWLRNLETAVNTVVGLSGSFFAARREVCTQWASNLQSDFNTLLNAAKLGLRGVSDPHSIGFYKNIADERRELERKMRTVLRGITVFMKSLPLLDPFRYKLFAWQLLSHKLARWLVPFAMISAYLSNIVLVPQSSLYAMSLFLQTSFY